MLAAIRFIPMFITGVLCNVFIAAFVAHVSLVWLMGEYNPSSIEESSSFLVELPLILS